jgi:hypothetical protein
VKNFLSRIDSHHVGASFAAVLLIANLPSSGDAMTGKSAGAPAMQGEQSFDANRGVILEGDAAREMAIMCGAQTESNGLKPAPKDVKDLEQELAPLLAGDLKQVGSDASPRQYYRQYAAGKLETRDAIVINGFHESYLSSVKDANWREGVVRVSDGGERYWCAIYIKGLKTHFVTYKKEGHDMHVRFNGLG